MRRASIVAALTALLLTTSCGSAGDDNAAEDADSPTMSSTSSTSLSPTAPTASASPTVPSPTASTSSPSDEPLQPIRQDEKNPSVAVAKTWTGGSVCGLLTKQHFSAAGVTVPNAKGVPEDDDGCSVDATGPYAGVLYGVPPKGEGGEEWPGVKRKYYGLSGNTAYTACDGEIVCQFSVALGGDRWAVVIVMQNSPSADQPATVASGKKLLAQLFAELPAA